MMLVFLEISTSSCELTDNQMIDTEVYKAFLSNLLNRSKQRTAESDNKMVNEQKYNESPYERVIRNLRTNWEMPMNYLQERGYLKNLGSQPDSSNNDLTMDAFNLVNGPLLNPSTFKNPYDLNSVLSTKTDRSDEAYVNNSLDGALVKKVENE